MEQKDYANKFASLAEREMKILERSDSGFVALFSFIPQGDGTARSGVVERIMNIDSHTLGVAFASMINETAKNSNIPVSFLMTEIIIEVGKYVALEAERVQVIEDEKEG
jgi:hypothetical protein